MILIIITMSVQNWDKQAKLFRSMFSVGIAAF